MLTMRTVVCAVICMGYVCTAWRRKGTQDQAHSARSVDTSARGSGLAGVDNSPHLDDFKARKPLARLLLQLNPSVAFRTPASNVVGIPSHAGKRLLRAEQHRMQLDETQPTPMSASALDEFIKKEGAGDLNMSLGNHIEEFRERLIFAAMTVLLLILVSFGFSKDLINTLESPIIETGVKFIQGNPSEYFFTSIKVSGYSGVLLGAPIILNQIIAYVVPGLTADEKKIFGPLLVGATVLFYTGLTFGFTALGPAALNFFLGFAEDSVESYFSIDEYTEFLGFMMLSTGVAFQVPIVQMLLAKLGVVNSEQMFSAWRYVVVGAIVLAGFLTPSTDPLTQCLLAGPLIGLYLGGASVVRLTESESTPS